MWSTLTNSKVAQWVIVSVSPGLEQYLDAYRCSAVCYQHSPSPLFSSLCLLPGITSLASCRPFAAGSPTDLPESPPSPSPGRRQGEASWWEPLGQWPFARRGSCVNQSIVLTGFSFLPCRHLLPRVLGDGLSCSSCRHITWVPEELSNWIWH